MRVGRHTRTIHLSPAYTYCLHPTAYGVRPYQPILSARNNRSRGGMLWTTLYPLPLFTHNLFTHLKEDLDLPYTTWWMNLRRYDQDRMAFKNPSLYLQSTQLSQLLQPPSRLTFAPHSLAIERAFGQASRQPAFKGRNHTCLFAEICFLVPHYSGRAQDTISLGIRTG